MGCEEHIDQKHSRFDEIKAVAVGGWRLTGTGFGVLFTRIENTEKKCLPQRPDASVDRRKLLLYLSSILLFPDSTHNDDFRQDCSCCHPRCLHQERRSLGTVVVVLWNIKMQYGPRAEKRGRETTKQWTDRATRPWCWYITYHGLRAGGGVANKRRSQS